jgi:hypothetical protein
MVRERSTLNSIPSLSIDEAYSSFMQGAGSGGAKRAITVAPGWLVDRPRVTRSGGVLSAKVLQGARPVFRGAGE